MEWIILSIGITAGFLITWFFWWRPNKQIKQLHNDVIYLKKLIKKDNIEGFILDKAIDAAPITGSPPVSRKQLIKIKNRLLLAQKAEVDIDAETYYDVGVVSAYLGDL